jgi:hypothetical protein
MAGFVYAGRIGGSGTPAIQDLTYKDTETLTAGDLVNLETGEIDLAATADANLLGVVLETQAGTDSTTKAKVIVDPMAIYRVTDNNARVIGATLDITGATGAQGVTTSSNKEFVVYADSGATDPTLVIINRDAHAFTKTQ